MSWSTVLEIVGVITGILYLLLAARENIWCWFFGAVSSLLGIILFFQVDLYAEAFLYFYYVIAAVYGWWSWKGGGRKDSYALPIQTWPVVNHVAGTVLVFLSGLLLGYLLELYTPASYPWVDSQTTVFSFWATYLTTRKVLSNWLYWIVIDAVSVGLYSNRGLLLYAVLMLLYTGMAIWGFYEWRQKKKAFI
jgi:nicotinamide mononucleotide transporter